ncbi:hypothetical protein ABW19_dt0201441 [Dactylella cylindrospora]|nr:hypothetical protein ABW19_dt0201441 [Dactylella cylindrospora]
MAPSNPQSPQDQVMDFINTLGEHMEEAFSHPAQQNEKGDDAQGASGNPPDYATSEKGEPSNNGNRSNERREGPFGRGGPWGGPWNATWRDNWREQAGQTHPWAAMASMFANPENFGPGGAFPFGPGGHGGPGGPGGPGGRGRGGFGGRGGYHGPWGWQSRRWGKGPHCHRGGNNDQEFIPAVDIFDTPDSFVVHIALAGALKEDIGINYDFDNAELQVSGVVHRPGDEEFLKHLVDGERRVGAFDRKIKLESNGKTVAVDADAITAKMENGLLEVTVPKLRKADEPEKKKISIA